MKKMLFLLAPLMMPTLASAQMKMSKKSFIETVPVDSPIALAIFGVLAAILAIRFMRKR